ncbi:MAG: DUF1801 domain-containing protein [Thermoleophilia bacterium]
MAERKGTRGKAASGGFTPEERAAMKERARELKAAQSRAEGERAVLERIAEMAEPDRTVAARVHEIVQATAPGLAPRTWYGMPAYARDGEVVCFFQDAGKFKTRYSTLGFSDKAALDDGPMWASSFALAGLTPEVEARIAALVERAVG